MKKGFSILEMLVIIAIMGIILAMTMYSYGEMRSRKQLEVTTDAINFKLEEAKTNAISGKNGSDFGIQFSTTTYTYFIGSSYNPSSPTNSSTTISSDLQISTNFSNGGKSIVFSRITGIPQTTGSITISSINNASNTDSISIGTLGEINVLK